MGYQQKVKDVGLCHVTPSSQNQDGESIADQTLNKNQFLLDGRSSLLDAHSFASYNSAQCRCAMKYRVSQFRRKKCRNQQTCPTCHIIKLSIAFSYQKMTSLRCLSNLSCESVYIPFQWRPLYIKIIKNMLYPLLHPVAH